MTTVPYGVEVPHPELLDLISVCAAGTATAADWRRLDAILTEDPACLQFYIAHMDMHAWLGKALRQPSLTLATRGAAAISAPAEQRPMRHAWSAQISRVAGVLNQIPVFAAIFAAAFLLFSLTTLAVLRTTASNRADSRPPVAKTGPTHPPAVARIAQMHQAIWADATTMPLAAGLPANALLRLNSGFVRLVSHSGVDLIVEGPAELQIQSKNRAQLRHGKLTARIHRAEGRGFSVETSSARIIDLGTEFGVEVDAQGRTHVEVFEGHVQVRPTAVAASEHRLTAGMRVTLDGAGREYAVAQSSRPAFVRTMPQKADAQYAAQVRQLQPLVFFRMDARQGRMLWDEVRQQSVGQVSHEGDPRRIYAAGPFGDALTVRGAPAMDHAILEPGTLGAERIPWDFSAGSDPAHPFSLALWVKGEKSQIDSACLIGMGLGNLEQFVIDHYDGCYRFFVRDHTGGDVWAQAAQGSDNTWQHVAATFDPAQLQIRLYINGKLGAESRIARPTLLAPTAPCRIGARPHLGAAPELSFQGRLDEVAIFGQVLTPEEIAALFSAGENSR